MKKHLSRRDLSFLDYDIDTVCSRDRLGTLSISFSQFAGLVPVVGIADQSL